MWINKVVWNHLSVSEDGRPTVYYQFLENILNANLTDIVLPASMTSLTGARFLRTFRFHPQIIYLDSSHEQGETLIELALYWNLLEAQVDFFLVLIGSGSLFILDVNEDFC